MLIFLLSVLTFLAYQLVVFLYGISQARVGAAYSPNSRRGIPLQSCPCRRAGRSAISEDAPLRIEQLSVIDRLLIVLVGPVSMLVVGLLLVSACLALDDRQLAVDTDAGMRLEISGVPNLSLTDDHSRKCGQGGVRRPRPNCEL